MPCDASSGAPEWSSHCGDLWRAAVRAATGRDICDVLGASPRRAGDWAAMMRRIGARSMVDVISFVHGEPIPIRLARRGDIVRRGWAIGICRGEIAEFFGGDMISLAVVDQAWPVRGWRHG